MSEREEEYAKPQFAVKQDPTGERWILGRGRRLYQPEGIFLYLRFELPPGTSEARAEELAQWLDAQFPEIAIACLVNEHGEMVPFDERLLDERVPTSSANALWRMGRRA